MNQTQTPTTKDPFAQWCILELMGHRRLAGYLTEHEIAGAALLRLDVPAQTVVTDGVTDTGGFASTQFYSPAAIYCITPTTEEIARAVAAQNTPEPVRRWELPTLAQAREQHIRETTGVNINVNVQECDACGDLTTDVRPFSDEMLCRTCRCEHTVDGSDPLDTAD